MNTISEEITTQCDVCHKPIHTMIATNDDNTFQFLMSIIKRIKCICDTCVMVDTTQIDNKLTQTQPTAVTKIQLESYQILMAEMSDFNLEAHLEWNQAQELQSLLHVFDLDSPELTDKLKNPNHAEVSKGIMWLRLSQKTCQEIKDMLKDKVM